MKTSAIFLDKDGTLIENIPFNKDPDQIRFLPGVLDGLKLLGTYGYQLIVISNQGGIAQGHLEEKDVKDLFRALNEKLDRAIQRSFDALYYCPHHPDGRI